MSVSVLGIAKDRALGVSVRVVVTRPHCLRAAKGAVDGVLGAIDEAASRFREDSELSLLNASPARPFKLSPLLAQAIDAALRGARLSDGAVDPTVGQAVRITGYDADFARMAPDGPPLRLVAKRVPGWRAVDFNPSSRTIVIPHGVELDLGATAKALAADLAAAAAWRAMAKDGGVLVSLGGDIAVAGEPPAGGWTIQTSEDSAAPLAEDEESVAVTSGGIATSGTTVRRWQRGGVVLHHIIDPATGLPVNSPWRTATAVAGTCVDANIASTAAIVLGDGAPAWLERHGVPARLVDNRGTVHRLAGWPAPAKSQAVPNIL